MRNVWLVIRREYLERVRTKSFVISTILMPAFVFAVTVLPTKLMMMQSPGSFHLVVAASSQPVADAVKTQLEAQKGERKFKVDEKITNSNDDRALLDADVRTHKIDGYLWLTDQAISDNQAAFAALSTSDFGLNQNIREAANRGVTRARLVQHGVAAGDIEALLKWVNLDTVALAGKKKGNELTQFFASFLAAMMIYISLIMYGQTVMRSVLEEKTTRVMEVLLSSLKPTELMAGKLLGVGAAGLTQVGIWAVFMAYLGSMGAALSPGLHDLFSNPLMFVFLPVFFLLGFMLYSAVYAALGAAVNSDQEAQQWMFFVMMPLIIPIILLTKVISSPDSGLSVWLSMVPFFSPILMYARVVASTVPWWQIGLAAAIMLATTYVIVIVAAKIYRVGILMYGKRPTLPEIVKWLKYA